MRTRLRRWIVAAGLLAPGCIEEKSEFWLNPDGRGKVAVEIVVRGDPSSGKAPEARASEAAFWKNPEKVEGIDAWKDVSFDEPEKGQVRFRGTAYFRTVASWAAWLDASHTPVLFRPVLSRDEPGRFALELRVDEGDKPAGGPLSDEAVSALAEEGKAKFLQQRPMVERALGAAKLDRTFHLPSEPVESENFQREGSVLKFSFAGKKQLEWMDRKIQDDAWVRERVRATGKIFAGADPDFMKEMFGAAGPIRAVFPAEGTPLFDYEKEAAEAKAWMAERRNALGLEPPEPAPEKPGEPREVPDPTPASPGP